MYICLFEGRKKRGTAFIKINFLLSKTKTDLYAVIYRKWLEAGRREFLFRDHLLYKNGPFKVIFSTPPGYPLLTANGQGPKASKKSCRSKTLNFVKIFRPGLSLRLLHSQEFRMVTHNRYPQEISKQGNTPESL